MGSIIAIGGEDLQKGDFEKHGFEIAIPNIDKEIIKLSGKEKPLVLFIPTASKNSEKYIGEFEKWFGEKLKCKTDILRIESSSSKKEIEDKILFSDIIYVGGGNTLRMMTLWRKLGVDKILKKAFSKGIVLSGVSAGGICWFNNGHSDSRSFTSKNASWPFIKVTGLGLYPFTFCPHYHFEKREKDFQRLILRDGGIGLAVDNRAAIEIVDDKFRILKAKPTGKAYRVSRVGDIVEELELNNREFKPLKDLL